MKNSKCFITLYQLKIKLLISMNYQGFCLVLNIKFVKSISVNIKWHSYYILYVFISPAWRGDRGGVCPWEDCERRNVVYTSTTFAFICIAHLRKSSHSWSFDEFYYHLKFTYDKKKIVQWKKYGFFKYYTAKIWRVFSNHMLI